MTEAEELKLVGTGELYSVTVMAGWDVETSIFACEQVAQDFAVYKANSLLDQSFGTFNDWQEACPAFASGDMVCLQSGAVLHTEASRMQTVVRSAPQWAWDTIDETLALDSESGAFSQDLRKDIARAIDAMESVQ